MRTKRPGSESETTLVRLTIRVKPRAKASKIVRTDGLSLEVSLAAPPVDGAANDDLIVLLAGALRLPKRSLAVVLGRASRTKVVEVIGLDPAEIVTRLARQEVRRTP